MNRGDQDTSLAATRTRELLEASTDSVRSELDHARGWLRETDLAQTAGYWQNEGVAGAIGSLANAWGRLTFLSRFAGTHDRTREDLDTTMDDLVRLFSAVTSGAPSTSEIDALRELADRLQRVYSTVRDNL